MIVSLFMLFTQYANDFYVLLILTVYTVSCDFYILCHVTSIYYVM